VFEIYKSLFAEPLQSFESSKINTARDHTKRRSQQQ